MSKSIKLIIVFISILMINISQAVEKDEQVLSFMITNEGINKGRIKIKQRPDDKSPFLIIGCNQKNEDFEILIGNLNKEDFKASSYSVITNFNKKSYKDTFIPIFKENTFYLTKKTNKVKDNQLFVYQYLKNNQVILEFPKNNVFYFNAKSSNKFIEYMNIIVSHCEMKF